MIQIGGQGAGGAGVPIFGFTTQNGNAGAGLEDLASYVLKANTLSQDGDWLEILWAVQCANNANNKLSAVVIGNITASARSGVPDANFARFHYVLFTRRGAAVSIATGDVATQGQQDLVLNTDGAFSLASDVTIAFRVQGVAANDLTNRQILIRKGSRPTNFTV